MTELINIYVQKGDQMIVAFGRATIDDWSFPYIIEREHRADGRFERHIYRGWRRLFLWPRWRRISG